MKFILTDYYLRKIDSDDRFENLNVILKSLKLTSEQISVVNEIVDDIAKCAIQKGFFDGLRHERDKEQK